MQNFWEKYVQPICLAIAAIFGIVSSWQGMLAKDRAGKAEASAQEIKQKLEQQASDREDVKVDRDYQVQVTTMALASLKENDTRAQAAMIGLVGTLPNTDLATKLTLALTTSSDPAVKKEATETLEAARAFEVQQRVDAKAAQAGKSPIGAAIGVTRQLTPRPNAKGWDIDIFWCDGVNDAKRRADVLGAVLAKQANEGLRVDGEILGRVRVRPLPALVNQRPQYQIFGDIIGPDAADPAEGQLARAVAAIAAGSGVPVAVRPGTKRSPWYVSVFFCAPA
jgi:hypothetical protein